MDKDARLLERFSGGDQEAFNELVSRWRTPIVCYLHRFLGDRERAEELAQEVFLKLYFKSRKFRPRPGATFKSYMFKVATNTALNERRRLARRIMTVPMDRPDSDDCRPMDPPDQKSLSPEDRQSGLEALEALKRGLALLPQRQAAALLMHAFHDMSHKDIGQSLGISEKAVKSLIKRSRDSLKHTLGSILDS
ncbi:MAG: RNA polymerase sigma factor [Deltaproteobacteria bacterium]|nr:RNA polymerase sigma factor [Deltaproteobacteria bacterium]